MFGHIYSLPTVNSWISNVNKEDGSIRIKNEDSITESCISFPGKHFWDYISLQKACIQGEWKISNKITACNENRGPATLPIFQWLLPFLFLSRARNWRCFRTAQHCAMILRMQGENDTHIPQQYAFFQRQNLPLACAFFSVIVGQQEKCNLHWVILTWVLLSSFILKSKKIWYNKAAIFVFHLDFP